MSNSDIVLSLLDAPREQSFDQLVELAARHIDVPVILFSVIDEGNERQFFKSSVGLSEPWNTKRQTPLTHSICQYVKVDRNPVVIGDVRADSRLSDNKAAQDLGVIAYLGVPVWLDDDSVAGALCAIDTKPRDWKDQEIRDLEIYAQSISRQIQLTAALSAVKKEYTKADKNNALLLERETISMIWQKTFRVPFSNISCVQTGQILSNTCHQDASKYGKSRDQTSRVTPPSCGRKCTVRT